MTETQAVEPLASPLQLREYIARLRLRRDDAGSLVLTASHDSVAEPVERVRKRPAPQVRIGAHDQALLDPLTVPARLR